ncbi:hypothetical protein ACLOJK_007302 [Asimina triloba]
MGEVRDCLDPLPLGYDYQDMSLAWSDAAKKSLTSSGKTRSASASKIPVAEFGPVPRLLEESPIRALVKRPKSSRGASEVDANVEVLIVDGIEIEHSSQTRFNVYIVKPTGKFAAADYGQFAGSFVTAAHGHRSSDDEKKTQKRGLKLGITELIKDIDAEDSESLVVTLVPTKSSVVIGGIRIEQVKSK